MSKLRIVSAKKWLLTAGALVCVLAMVFTALIIISPRAQAEDVDPVDINTSAALLQFAQDFALDGYYPDDIPIVLGMEDGDAYILNSLSGFEGIGTPSKPYNGKVTIKTNSKNSFLLDAPLFKAITTNVEIVDENDQARSINIARISPFIDAPLFAESVVTDEDNPNAVADWSVTLITDTLSSTDDSANDFAGVIKSIDDGCKVNITFVHSAIDSDDVIANCKSADDVGLICGTLGEGAELSVNVTASSDVLTSDNNFVVRSTGSNKNAGGIVGTMATGSKLTIQNGFTSISNVTSDAGYAGGIVGEATDAFVTVPDPTATSPVQYFTVSKTVTGSTGAGGVYGKYTSTKDDTGTAGGTRTFDLKHVHSDANFAVSSASSNGNSGGVIGELIASNNITVDGGVNLGATDSGTYDRTVKLNGGKNRGGVIGSYENSSLDNVLEIVNNKVSVSSNATGNESPAISGAIGKITGSSAAYVKISDFAVKNTNSGEKPDKFSAALIGDMGTAGSFLDTDGVIAVCGAYNAGLVYAQNAGVIRFKGVTDLGGKYFGAVATTDEGQLVAKRDNGLIYALGSGADADNTTTGWTFRRGTSRIDDVGDWGEVLRLKSDYNGLSESDFFTTVDMTHHTVTVAAHVENMATIKDFIKTALNIQLNDQDRGALKFASSASKRDTVLESNLSITDDISLEKTGIVSLMRDNGNEDTLKGYSGTFTGNGHTVTLAIGEPYGYAGTGTTALTSDDRGNYNYGTVFGHTLLGLFSKTESGASITGLTTDGFISLAANQNKSYFVGGVAGYVSGTGTPLTLSNVTTSQQNLVFITNNSASVRCGGALGQIASGCAGTLSVSNCVFDNDTVETRSAGAGYFGGGVGYVASTSDLTMNFNTVTLSGTYNNTASSATGSVHYGGLISFIVNASTVDNRKLNLNTVTVTNDVVINNKTSGTARSTGSGAFLGSEWYDTKVTVGTDGSSTDGVTIGSSGVGAGPSITVASGSGNCNIGALVYKGTGYWRLNNVKVNKAVINASNGSNKSFGYVANDGIINTDSVKSALFLELVSDHYDIAATTINGNPAVFDEVVAFSHYASGNTNTIENNGQAIISIRTASGAPIVMDGSAINTYQNQTTYGKASDKYNPHCRYYYNLDSIRTNTTDPTAAEKLLMWSVNKYAQDKIKQYFTNGFTTDISGNCDMVGLSYYPVDASGMTIGANGATTVKFYNKEIETGEAASSGGSDSLVRTTRDTVIDSTQHYLMHSGIFLNYTGDLSANDLTLQGNIGRQDFGSGFIVASLYGDDDDETSRMSLTNVILDGAFVNDVSGCSPLIINDVGINSSINIDGLKQHNYSTLSNTYAASSLIGDVGADDATNISLNFSKMVLDGRSGALSTNTGLNNAYGTSTSIFSRATFLNSFAYLNSGLAVYNYEYSEDWGSTLHQVTYAKEITTSVEYANKQKHYYDDSVNYTNPTDGTSPTSEYNFSTGFLPHVWNDASLGLTKTHEVRVNVKDIALIVGCGQYNDPYIITDGGMLSTAANIIYGVPDTNIKVMLPDDCDASPDMWCDYVRDNTNTTKDRLYTYIGGQFVADDGSGNKTLAKVREYLAGAYYKIANPIEISTGYKGLGAVDDTWTSTNFECQYAFRGVIVGSGLTEIKNYSDNPLIKNANGCVVKGVVVDVRGEITIEQTTFVEFKYDSSGCYSFGGVIGKVMGGDNIIDSVGVDFRNATFVEGSNSWRRLVPVGGYVGVIVNGGVIFRNMAEIANTYKSGLTSDELSFVTDPGWLYINPIIGRVLAGYSFTESSSYVYEENSATMKNGLKNYGIPDIKSTGLTNEEKLNPVYDSNSKMMIDVPNDQSLYVLSCIVNSGAGCADKGDNNGEKAYQDISTGTTPWIAYRTYCSTRCAAYSDVATGIASSADYDIVKDWDVYTGRIKVPYIIKQYTLSTRKGSKDIYRARSICYKTKPEYIDFSATTYYLPAGYRGIGNIYYNSSYLYLSFNTLNGNNAVIDLRMVYNEYDARSNNGEYYKAKSDVNGFGLFNNLYINSASEDNCVKDLTLSGSIKYDIRGLSGNAINYNHRGNDNTTENDIRPGTILNVGGIAGRANTNVYLSNISLNALEVEGAKNAAGMVGYSNTKNVTIMSPSSTSLKVTAGLYAGGIVGYFTGASKLTIKGEEDNYAVIDINQIAGKGIVTDTKLGQDDRSKEFVTAAGLCAYFYTNSNNSEAQKTDVQYVTVRNGTIKTINQGTPDDLRYKGIASGLFGVTKNSRFDVSDINIEQVNFKGDICGGVVGYGFSGNNSGLYGTFKNIKVSGGTGYMFDAINDSGGFFGFFQGATIQLDISSLIVENYILRATEVTASRACVGGVTAYIYATSSSTRFNFYDTLIRNCTLSLASTSDKDGAEFYGAGGLVGTLPHANCILKGANILLDDVTITGSSRHNPGLIAGDTTKSPTIKLVGVSIQGGSRHSVSMVGVKKSNDTYGYGTNGYVVLADYNGACVGASPNTARSTLLPTIENDPDLAAASPYVTVNPSANIGNSSVVLTGDGIAPTVAGLAVNGVLSDSSASQPMYTVSAAYRDYFRTNNNGITNYYGNLSTYNSVQSVPVADDFAVLTVEDSSRSTTTEMINAYINLIANTNYPIDYANSKYGYAKDNDNIFKVQIYKMNYNNNRFEIADGEANLKRDNSSGKYQFYFTNNGFDTAGQMFSLIDVQFKDPSNTSNIAYHLYIPVVVKKIMTFDFDIATASGTNYERNWYSANNRYGKPLMENLGTPATIYFKYTYMRSAGEWENAVNNGESLMRNFEKKLVFTKSDEIKDLRSDTVLVLVDPNNGGKEYYATFGDACTDGVLELKKFREDLNSGAYFKPVDLQNYVSLEYEQSSDGLYVECTEENAAVKATPHNGGDVKYFRLKTNQDSGQTYKFKVTSTDVSGYVPAVESYYISFFTVKDESDNIYHYSITCPQTFEDLDNPSRINNIQKLSSEGSGNAHIILGNIFEQDHYSLQTNNTNTEMSIFNDTLTATIKSTVKIKHSAFNKVDTYIREDSAIQVYQSFLVNLTRTDDDGSLKIITGNPTVGGTYTVDSVNGQVAQASGSYDPTHNSNYAEFELNLGTPQQPRGINTYLKTGGGADITAEVSLRYTGDDNLLAQFPSKPNGNGPKGVTVSGSSNVGFDFASTALSKETVQMGDPQNRLYYCKIVADKAKLYYNVKGDVFEGDYATLGINPLDNNGLTRSVVSTIGVYDISRILEAAQGYDMVRAKIKLSRRQDNYATPLAIDTYVKDLHFVGFDTTSASYTYPDPDNLAGLTEYVYTFPRSWVVDDPANMYEDTSLSLPIDFTVVTGGEFEDLDLCYSNYKITLTVELFKARQGGGFEYLDESRDSNYLVYTNARIVPDFIMTN